MTIGKLDKWVYFSSKVGSFTFYIDNFDCTKKIIVLERWTYYIVFFIFFLLLLLLGSRWFNWLSIGSISFQTICHFWQRKSHCNFALYIVNFSHHSCLQWNNKNIKNHTSSSYEILVNEMRHDVHKKSKQTLDD